MTQPLQQSMQVELPTTRTIHRNARTVNVPERDIVKPIPDEIIQRRVIDPSFDSNNPGRWNKNFMTTLNNQKIRYDQRMLNPRYAQEVAERHQGWTYSDTVDIDEDGTVDIALRDANGELVWFNGYRRRPAPNHTYEATNWF